MKAAFFGAMQSVRLLMQRGADINLTNNLGQRAVDFASMSGRPEIISFLNSF